MKLPKPFGYMNAGQLSELLTTNLPYGYVYPSKAVSASGSLYTEQQMREMYCQGLEDAIKQIEAYRIPVGNSSSGELACEWTYDALKEIRDEIRALKEQANDTNK